MSPRQRELHYANSFGKADRPFYPTKGEQFIWNLCWEGRSLGLLDADYEYGGDNMIPVAGNYPDLVDRRHKKVILVDGVVIHSKEWARQHGRQWRSPSERVPPYLRAGYDVMIIEDDVSSEPSEILNQIIQFSRRMGEKPIALLWTKSGLGTVLFP